MKPFDIIDISGDVGIRAYGKTLDDAFSSAAIGMYSLITNLDDVKEKRNITIEIESHSPEGLLVSWLNELIFHFDTYGFIGKDVHISAMYDNKLTATVAGEDFDAERHERRLLVKAATYHQLRIEKIGDTWQIDVIFDI
ncbi:MAG: archease [Thermodesulfovibrionales bacterium]